MQELKERFDGLNIITERTANGKTIYKFRGPFQEMNDIRNNKNRNGRVYTRKLWEKVLQDENVLERLNSKRMLGELDHPTDDGQIRRTSHIVTKIKPNYNEGIIYGELELLNHDQGDAALLRALVDQGVQLCVSSRAYGDFLEDGRTIDPDTFKLTTWDVVLDPSVSIAQLNKVSESVNKALDGESRARSNFVERTSFSEKLKDEQLNEHKSGGLTMDELKKLMTENKELAVANGIHETNIGHMKTLLDEKNKALETTESALSENKEKLETLSADAEKSADLLEKATAENKELKEKNEALEAKLKEYEEIEEQAVEAIETLKEEKEELVAKVEEQEKLGEEAAEVINNLVDKKDESKKDESSEKKDESKKDESEEKKDESKKEADMDKGDEEKSDEKKEADMNKDDDDEEDDEEKSDEKKEAAHREDISARMFEAVAGKKYEKK